MSPLGSKFMPWWLSLGAATCVRAIEIDLSLEKPSTALPIPAGMCGLSIEADRFVDWAGEPGDRNEFTWHLMNNIQVRTGVAPPIRVGGGSQDFIINVDELDNEDPGFYNIFKPVPDYDDLESTKELFPQAYFTGAGYKYWRAACNFPPTTSFTFGVNLLAGNTSEAIAQIKNIERAFAESDCDHINLYAIEIGNEADQWDDGRRDDDEDIYAYSAQQIEYYQAINDTLGDNGRKYRFGDSASRWSVHGMLDTDALQGEWASSINSLSVHHYHSTGKLDSRSAWPGKASGLINKTSIRTELDYYEDSVVLAADANHSFVLGETGTFASHGQQGVSNSAAAALWLVDYSLHAAVVGISGLFFHQGIGYNYSAFEPLDHVGINITDYAPNATHHTLPEYYGYLVVAEAIGSTQDAYINEVEVDSSVALTVFEVYEGDHLARVVLIESRPWTELSTGDRPDTHVELPQLKGYDGARYKLLEFDSLSVTSGLTWGGQSFETESGEAKGEEVFHELDSSGIIALLSSSVAVVYL